MELGKEFNPQRSSKRSPYSVDKKESKRVLTLRLDCGHTNNRWEYDLREEPHQYNESPDKLRKKLHKKLDLILDKVFG